MDSETRQAFARIDHYFELNQAQLIELRRDLGGQISSLDAKLGGQIASLDARVEGLDARVEGLDARVEGLDARLAALESQFRSFRDWVTTEFAILRREMSALRASVERRFAADS